MSGLDAHFTRRRFLGLAAGGLTVGALGALSITRRGDSPSAEPALAATTETPTPTSTPTVAPTPTPEPEPPVMPRGRDEVVLMAGTEWEARGSIFHSGVAGPRFMVLGGVHGNEPGGWLGAEATAQWEVDRGMLIVLPRINHRAAAAFERTLEGAGDLNRLYPGDPDGPPMAQMAYEITTLAKHWRPHWLWDMHESWGFYNERGDNRGTAFIGQTITSSNAEANAEIEALVAQVNAEITEREAFQTRMRPGGRFGFDEFSPPSDEALRGRRGSSSLSLGNHITGLRPVLVEMGQMNQPEARRSELHQLLVRRMMERLQMLPLA